MLISIPYMFNACESADQHQQRRSRHMEVRHQSVYKFKTISGRNKKPCLAAAGDKLFAAECGFKGAQTGSADRGNPAAACSSTTYRECRLFGDRVMLTVHDVLTYVINFNR